MTNGEIIDLSNIPDGYDWIIGSTNKGLTIHTQLGQDILEFGDTPQEALDAAIKKYWENSGYTPDKVIKR